MSDQKTVHSAFVRFRGLLYKLGLSPNRNEVLAVKVEVDTNPPAGAGLRMSVVRRHVILQLQHHDRASLLAGKLHAILQRPYTKGRHIYDLLWYVSDPDWPAPNLVVMYGLFHAWNSSSYSRSWAKSRSETGLLLTDDMDPDNVRF